MDQLADFRRGEVFRAGVKLAIYGPPNVGKSSLFNVLGKLSLELSKWHTLIAVSAQRDAAIVTDIPGTTRDILEITLDMGGLPVIVADTAGLRASGDMVEQIGVSRAIEKYALVFVHLHLFADADTRQSQCG